jgi:transposase-like protein
MSSSVQSSEPVGGLDPDIGSVNPAAKPVRRSFTAEYRARVIAEYAAAPHGEKSAVLRREGLYQSQIREWTDARDALARGLVPKRNSHHRSGKSAGSSQEADRLRAENARLTRELAKSQAVVEIMGKLQGLCAPRGARSYPRLSRERLEGRFLGLMAYPSPKG